MGRTGTEVGCWADRLRGSPNAAARKATMRRMLRMKLVFIFADGGECLPG